MRFAKKYPKASKYKVFDPCVCKGMLQDKCEVCNRKTRWYSPTGPFLCSDKCYTLWHGDDDLLNAHHKKSKKEIKSHWLQWLRSSESRSWAIAMRLLGNPPEAVAYIAGTKPLKPDFEIMEDQIVGYDQKRKLSPEDWVAQYKEQGYKTITIFRWAWFFYREGKCDGIWFERTDYFKACLYIILGTTNVEKRKVTRFYDNRVRPFWVKYRNYRESLPAEREFQERVRKQMAQLKAIKKAEKIATQVRAQRKADKIIKRKRKEEKKSHHAILRFNRRKRRK